MTTPFIRSTMAWMLDAGFDVAEPMWFDVSKSISKEDYPGDWLRNYRPPFEKNMVLYEGPWRNYPQYEFMCVVVGTDPQEGVLVTLYRGAKGAHPVKTPTLVYVYDQSSDTVKFGPVEPDDIVTEEDGRLALGFVTMWYSSLAKGSQAHQAVMRDTFTNRRKIAEGKKPSYEWRTVVVEAKSARSESRGGTHASPRLHDRRGHLRRLATGKNVWVRPCKVGRADLGVVFHDYEIR